VLVLTSLRPPQDAAVAGWWVGGHGWGLESYREAFASGALAGSLLATAVRAVSATALLLLVAVPAAYALDSEGLPRRTREAIVTITAVLAVVPVQAVADPLGRVFDALRLSGAPTALTLVHVAIGVPFAVLLLRPAFRAVPERELALARAGDADRAAAPATVISRSWTTIVAVAVLEFMFVWNDLVVGLILGGPENGPITLVLFGQARQFATSSGVMAAGAVVSMVLPLALVLATGRWVVQGLTVGVTR
jgi:alpha-glucoside transport system permease protein